MVETTGRSVKVETEILRGRPAAILVSESEDAEMDCVGSTGIDRYSRALLCSTATEVAEKSHCPVMVVRPQQDRARRQINWIIVAADDAPGSDLVVDQALREARLRKLPVLAIGTTPQDTADARTRTLDDHLKPWRRWYPDVHIAA